MKYDPMEDWYKVQYEDGDSEEWDERQIEDGKELLKHHQFRKGQCAAGRPPKDGRRPSMRRASSYCATGLTVCISGLGWLDLAGRTEFLGVKYYDGKVKARVYIGNEVGGMRDGKEINRFQDDEESAARTVDNCALPS